VRQTGIHASIAGGITKSLERAAQLGCDTLQIFSHSPRAWRMTKRSEEEAAAFRRLRQQSGIGPVFIHVSYLVNLASRDGSLFRKSVEMVTAEMNIADMLDADYVVLHTGSASGDNPVEARKRATAALSEVSEMGSWRAGILLENTAGERGDIASRIADLGTIMEQLEGGLIAGICLDTCHAYAAGYDIASVKGVATLSAEIEYHIGCHRVKLIHLNDSKGELGSGRDRHEHIGKGRIGIKGFNNLLQCPCFSNIPLILETPKKTDNDDPANLRTVRNIVSKTDRNRRNNTQ
jgi:deoxyribonuclease-4